MANKGNNKTRIRPGKRRVKSDGFKRKKVISRRKKVSNSAGFCKTTGPDFVPAHIIRRHEGRRIRKRARIAGSPQPLKAV